MASSVPAIVWPINFGLQSGNPLCQGVANSAALDSAQLIQGDQRLLQIYFLLAALQQGGAPTNVQLPAGATLAVAGKLADDLEATTVLFEALAFVQLQNSGNLYFCQAFLDLNTDEIGEAFAAAGDDQNTLACLVDVIVTVPAQAAAGASPAVPASRATYQIAVSLKRQVYNGGESNPTPATPTYPAPADVQVKSGSLNYLPTLTGLTGGGTANLDGLPSAALPSYYALLVMTFAGATLARLELDTDPANAAQVIVPPDHDPVANPRSWRVRL